MIGHRRLGRDIFSRLILGLRQRGMRACSRSCRRRHWPTLPVGLVRRIIRRRDRRIISGRLIDYLLSFPAIVWADRGNRRRAASDLPTLIAVRHRECFRRCPEIVRTPGR